MKTIGFRWIAEIDDGIFLENSSKALATQMRKTARRVFKDWKDQDNAADE